MKRKILVLAVLQLFMVLGSCSSDSGDNSGQNPDEKKGSIKADYITDIASTDDFVINNDNTIYHIGQRNYIELKKIDLEGKVTSLKTFDYSYSESQLSFSKSGDIFLINRFTNSLESDKIYRFENNFSELNPFYTMKPISSPFANKIKLMSICNNNDNTYFVFDYGNKQIKRFVPELSGDVFVAGSEKNEIKDGTGLNAGFGAVTRIISQNNILYLIDNLYEDTSSAFVSSNIRKLEFVNNEWKVTTLISSTTETYIDIAFDSKNELYVVIKNKGISKLNLQNNTLSLFKEGEIKVWKDNFNYSNSSQNIERMKIKENDIYLILSGNFIKISDFQTKFAAVEK